MKFKLNPFIKETYSLPVFVNKPNGGLERVRYNIEPNATYDTKDYVKDTPSIDDIIRNTIVYIPYSDATKKILDDLHAKYDFYKCKSCGGKITKFRLIVFEEVK